MASKRNVLTFEWDAAERVGGNEHLTPVYFHKQVLIRYLYDSRFYCDFTSDSYGQVGNDEFEISFGVNRNGSVVVWLGDLIKDVPKREQFYWLVENKEPEHDPHSEFYESQINCKFTEPPAAVACLNALARLNSSFHKRFSVHLYRQESVEERVEETRRYKRLMQNNIDDFKRFVSEFNEIINENTNNAEVRRFLAEKNVPVPKDTKGNKLLEKVYQQVLGDDENLIAPFFFLYDLRLWADHAIDDQMRNDVAVKLGIGNPENYDMLMSALLKAITESCKKLEARVGL